MCLGGVWSGLETVSQPSQDRNLIPNANLHDTNSGLLMGRSSPACLFLLRSAATMAYGVCIICFADLPTIVDNQGTVFSSFCCMAAVRPPPPPPAMVCLELTGKAYKIWARCSARCFLPTYCCCVEWTRVTPLTPILGRKAWLMNKLVIYIY